MSAFKLMRYMDAATESSFANSNENYKSSLMYQPVNSQGNDEWDTASQAGRTKNGYLHVIIVAEQDNWSKTTLNDVIDLNYSMQKATSHYKQACISF